MPLFSGASLLFRRFGIPDPLRGQESRLPEYAQPPVVEVAISLQFKPLESLRSAHFGLFWQLLRVNGFSRIEDHGTLEPTEEEFDVPPPPRVGLRLRTFDDAPPLPRVWFLNETEDQLVPLQRDRLVVNWRQGPEPRPYLRYTKIIEWFRYALSKLEGLVASEQLGDIIPVQCEITYVNHIRTEFNSDLLGDPSRVATVWSGRYSDGYLPRPEDVGFSIRDRMTNADGKVLGRLHVALQRRIHPYMTVVDENTGQRRPTSQNFNDSKDGTPMSVLPRSSRLSTARNRRISSEAGGVASIW